VTPWENAWLNGKPMPPHGLPKLLLIEAQAIAEEWLLAPEIRSMVEEWAPRDRAEDAVVEVLWSGCRLHGEQTKRVPPVPVVVRLAYSEPFPGNIVELEDRMMELRRVAVNEWIEQFQKYGDKLEAAI
jgi:hypothetical protein